ncbi:hypothetical protein thalar_01607 [Litoreibacter arenae DSM 19593]|uniref:Uncharacterized protein n=1 Tax=Litoreibacter arenae DSM 19593 TaxID=1123360 RepID=S9QKF6_9RHOB|nr:hypothetical protein thalar_01607 [Litoreibacter arenae DSM 19593]
MNDWKREIRWDAEDRVPRLRTDAAAANTRKGYGGKVRIA